MNDLVILPPKDDRERILNVFCTEDGEVYADVLINGRRETLPIRGKRFRNWLGLDRHARTDSWPTRSALTSDIERLEAHAQFRSPRSQLYRRVAEVDGRVYLDLGDDERNVISIGPEGWRIETHVPVRFFRAPGMQGLPVPTPGGSIKQLRRFLNVESEGDFVLLVSWLLSTYRPRGPYPVLQLVGEQGTAKSTTARVLRNLVDPNRAPIRALPHSDRELFISAKNGHVLAFDNASALPHFMSDAFCRLATGGGFSSRRLFSDADEVLIDATKPILINGIENVVTRQDLAERAITINFPEISSGQRRTQAELLAEFETERPEILGALLSAVSKGLHNLPNVKLGQLPRMADFAQWAKACEQAIESEVGFEAAYAANQDEAASNALEADCVAGAILNMARDGRSGEVVYNGPAAILLNTLRERYPNNIDRDWPRSPRGFGGRLRRAAPALRIAGVTISFDRDASRERTRMIRIANT